MSLPTNGKYAQATQVHDHVIKVQIPNGLHTGDSFIVNPPQGRAFTVIIPEGATSGSFLDVFVPDEVDVPVAGEQPRDSNYRNKMDKDSIKMSKATLGAAVAGGILGLAVAGPITAAALAGAAAYATTTDGKVGDSAKKVGQQTYKTAAKAKNWMVKKYGEHVEKKAAEKALNNINS